MTKRLSLLGGFLRQNHREGASKRRGATDLDFASMPSDNRLNQAQSQTCAGNRTAFINTVEAIKDMRDLV